MIGSAGTAAHYLPAQLRTLEHRGRDAVGIFDGQGGAIGQTRLAVIDLQTGDPPVRNEDGSVAAMLNGEIYNFRAIRARLAADGARLRTSGDTEVIAHLARRYEPIEIAEQLDGMFALAIWDLRSRQLILARDRVGKKPLYYWTDGRMLVFASEIKGVLAHPAVPRRLNEKAVPAYLTFGYVPTPATFYDGIVSLPPGHVLVMTPGTHPELHAYWKPPRGTSLREKPVGLDRAASVVRAGLEGAVKRRLVTDVPLGAFLSGGVDSSAIVAIMAQAGGMKVPTFTVGFEDDEGFDERPYGRAVAKLFGTDHTEFVVSPNATDLAERLVYYYDQPFGDSSAIPTFLLAELTRKHVTVALTGDGGDELFAGYERFAAAMALQRLQFLPRPVLRAIGRSATALPERLPGRFRSLRRWLAACGVSQVHLALLEWVSTVPGGWRNSLLPKVSGSGWAVDDYNAKWEETKGVGLLDRLLLLNLQTYLLDDLLQKADRMSMAHGLEVRSPFLDTEMVELAFGLPPQTKLKGFSRKRVLKEAMSDLLPREILFRRKRGFGVPLDRWFRGELRTYVESMLCSKQSALRHVLLPTAIDEMVSSHMTGSIDAGQSLWALLTLAIFLRKEAW